MILKLLKLDVNDILYGQDSKFPSELFRETQTIVLSYPFVIFRRWIQSFGDINLIIIFSLHYSIFIELY